MFNNLKKDLKDRIDPNTTGGLWRKIQTISGVVWAVSSTPLALAQLGIFTLNPVVGTILGSVVTISSILYGRGRLDKSNK